MYFKLTNQFHKAQKIRASTALLGEKNACEYSNFSDRFQLLREEVR